MPPGVNDLKTIKNKMKLNSILENYEKSKWPKFIYNNNNKLYVNYFFYY